MSHSKPLSWKNKIFILIVVWVSMNWVLADLLFPLTQYADSPHMWQRILPFTGIILSTVLTAVLGFFLK